MLLPMPSAILVVGSSLEAKSIERVRRGDGKEGMDSWDRASVVRRVAE